MTRRRRFWLAAGAAGLLSLLAALVGQAATSGLRTEPATPVERPSAAMQLLKAAASTSAARPWTGTHRVVWVRGGFPRLALVKVAHEPGTGTTAELLSPGQLAMADTLDATKLHVLDDHYDLVLQDRPPDRSGAALIEVRRPGVTGPGAVAGRFWVDTRTGMVVRRDVLDRDGVLCRSSILDSVSLGPGPTRLTPVGRPPSTSAAGPSRALATTGTRLDDDALRALAAQGWPVRRSLPGGMDLMETRLHDRDGAQVLQQSYTDGLSTMSLFVQAGELGYQPAGTPRPLDRSSTVWVQPGPPERIVWSAEGRTWTLVSDAPETAVEAALLSLPRTPRAVGDNPAARIWRGMGVVGGWLNPFS